jgi:ABC-type sugar transport system ATPase subunit
MSRLHLQHISKSFMAIKALQQVDVVFKAGEIHAICGENGAGKSTLMNILAGNLQPDAGEIKIDSKTVEFSSPKQAFDYGIATVYQHLSLSDNLSVAENIFANQQPRNRWGLIDFDELYKQANHLLELLQLKFINPRTQVAKLPAPQKQLVEIAKALSKKPSILILDEPTASLTESETRVFFPILQRLRNEAVTILYISHRLDEVFQLADRITILKDGQAQGTFDIETLDKQKLIKLMVGRDVINLKSQSTKTDHVLLNVEKISSSKFKEISFQLHEGEILGLAGLVGAGRTEIARAIFGVDKMESGEIHLESQQLKTQHPSEAIANGIAYVPEDRRSSGLFTEMSVQDNIVAAALKKVTTGNLFSAMKVKTQAEQYKEKLQIATTDVTNPVNDLSGGNQQKVVLAKWLFTDPRVLIVDEPTQGVDVGAKFEIYEILKSLAAQGKGILVISSELPELIGLCDRILVINKGKIAGEMKGEGATEEKILELAAN